jgi:hypothetical protein
LKNQQKNQGLIMTAIATRDLRMQQRAKLLSKGLGSHQVKISALNSQKASKDSIKLISSTYNSGFVTA